MAKRTFNHRLVIVGGLSILGTSGIVEPISDTDMIGSIRADLSVRYAAGEWIVLKQIEKLSEKNFKNRISELSKKQNKLKELSITL